MPNNIIHLPGNINATQILYEDNLNIKSKINDIQTSITETNDANDEELENIETQINDKTTELNQKISNIINTSCIETQAITYSSTNPNTIYFSTDTNCVIINGEIYGRGQHLSNVFRLIPSGKTIGSTGYDNTNIIYIQPDGTNFTLYYYSTNNTWESIGNIAFDIAIDASDITYDLTNTPDLGDGDVQSAIEALDGKVEDLRDEVFGDEWVDMMYGCYGAELWRSAQLYNNTFSGTNVNYRCLIFRVNPGDEFRLRGMSNVQSGGGGRCWGIYNEFPSNIASITNLQEIFISGGTNYTTSVHGIDDDVTIPTGGKMLIVMSQYNGNYWNDLRIYKHSTTPLSIADKIGYKINTWTDDEIITSTSLAVGSIVPYWSDDTRYGCRGVRLNVKEGDKILLDTYSPALFGLIFTDENRVVKALYDDRRFDGVWTAPVNGYCYIQDVLYRDNFHYASAHGHLAYMAHDARKRVAKGGDWYNEYAPRLFNEFFPYTDTFTASGITRNTDFPIVNNSAALLCYSNKKFQLHMAKLRYADGSPMVSDGSYIHLRLNGSDTGSIINDRAYPAEMPDGKSTWIYAIVNTTLNAFASTMLRPYIIGLTRGTTYSIIWEKIFVHTSSDFGELYALAQKIINGEVEVDNFYGVREKEVDLVSNTIGLQSINDLGYNILNYGATLPIDEDGYKYAKEIYDRYKDNPPTGNIRALFANDQKLVYFPNIDLSNATAIGGNTLASLFMNCYNLKVIPPLNLTGNLSCSYTIQGCRSLKRIESLGDVKVTNGAANFMYSCFALEYVGKIDTSECTSFWGLLGNAYSLKRIEELDLGKVSQWGSGTSVTWPGNAPVLEYMLLKNIFRLPSQTTHIFSNAPKWGINSEENPDARQSLVDSLLTYSYDRVNDPDGLGTADTTCTITLSANTYNQLTTSEIDAITAKGYTLKHP